MVNWWERQENVWERGDFGANPDMADYGGADLVQDPISISDMEHTPLGEPEVDFDVRAVYDSRFVNSYDFNVSQSVNTAGGNSAPGTWFSQFSVPLGYRMIPRRFTITFDPVPGGAQNNSLCSILQQGVGLPNNLNIILGMGGTIETFFICEELTTFGVSGNNGNVPSGQSPAVNINVWGQLFPVTDVALPFTGSNKKVGS